MIIEIKNLPEGRKLKHVNFEVTFEDGEPTLVTPSVTRERPVAARTEPPVSTIAPMDSNIRREPKAIPGEMTDLEF